jgi:hypothetical protein
MSHLSNPSPTQSLSLAASSHSKAAAPATAPGFMPARATNENDRVPLWQGPSSVQLKSQAKTLPRISLPASAFPSIYPVWGKTSPPTLRSSSNILQTTWKPRFPHPLEEIEALGSSYSRGRWRSLHPGNEADYPPIPQPRPRMPPRRRGRPIAEIQRSAARVTFVSRGRPNAAAISPAPGARPEESRAGTTRRILEGGLLRRHGLRLTPIMREARGRLRPRRS